METPSPCEVLPGQGTVGRWPRVPRGSQRAGGPLLPSHTSSDQASTMFASQGDSEITPVRSGRVDGEMWREDLNLSLGKREKHLDLDFRIIRGEKVGKALTL